MCIDFIIISYLINCVLVYSALYIKRDKLNLFAHAKLRENGLQGDIGGDLAANDF